MRFHSTALVLPALLISLLAGCASVSTQLPDIAAPKLSAEQSHQEVMAFDEMDRLQQRLMQVARPVLKANKELCPKTRQDIGVMMHSEKNYSKALRPAARRDIGAGKELSVRLIVKGAAADAAGLHVGDKFINDKGKVTSPFSKNVQTALKDGAPLRIKRGAEELSLNVKSETLCGYTVRLAQTSTINAYADGSNITMTSGMMNFVKNDDELALIVGHELAHNTMGHIRKVITNYILSFGGTRYTRPFESEADYVGLYYMVRAGFNPDDVESFWRRLAVANPKSVAHAKTHPKYSNRYLSIAAAREEIKSKKAAGEPLVPNFKTDDEKS